MGLSFGKGILVGGFLALGIGAIAAPPKPIGKAPAARAKSPATFSDKPLKSYEVRVNTQMEWLILEQLKLGAQPTHFLKFRRGHRTVALSVITKQDFERWSRDIMAVKTSRQPACAHPFEARAFVDGIRYVNRFCPGPAADPQVRNLGKSTTEMLSHLRQFDGLKGKGR